MHSGSPYDLSPLVEIDTAPSSATYIVRGEMTDTDRAKIEREVSRGGIVVGIYADVKIEPFGICPNPTTAIGSHTDVERLIGVPRMRRCGMDGRDVLVAVVDEGLDTQILSLTGKAPRFDLARSWAVEAGVNPGKSGISHGTMCAWDICIGAPNCTLLDIVLFKRSQPEDSPITAWISDAVRAYEHLASLLTGSIRPPSLVVNNSWGMARPSEDFPVGDPGNYSDNPNHPFNKSVAILDSLGADILFAAGNCGPECPDKRCYQEGKAITSNAIYGANSHQSVLCVAAVTAEKYPQRLGFSNVGPGRLTQRKPDIAGYAHFRGSGIYPSNPLTTPPDSGTSAACPVVAGVVAALRSKRPYSLFNPATWPASIRSLVTSTAQNLGPIGFDYEYGYGVINGGLLARKLCPDSVPTTIDLCRLMPWLCENQREEPFPPLDIPDPRSLGRISGRDLAGLFQWLRGERSNIGMGDIRDEAEPPDDAAMAAILAYYIGYHQAHQQGSVQSKSGNCGCRGK
jgi:hypothetical protein